MPTRRRTPTSIPTDTDPRTQAERELRELVLTGADTDAAGLRRLLLDAGRTHEWLDSLQENARRREELRTSPSCVQDAEEDFAQALKALHDFDDETERMLRERASDRARLDKTLRRRQLAVQHAYRDAAEFGGLRLELGEDIDLDTYRLTSGASGVSHFDPDAPRLFVPEATVSRENARRAAIVEQDYRERLEAWRDEHADLHPHKQRRARDIPAKVPTPPEPRPWRELAKLPRVERARLHAEAQEREAADIVTPNQTRMM